jgi:hypothetical protein
VRVSSRYGFLTLAFALFFGGMIYFLTERSRRLAQFDFRIDSHRVKKEPHGSVGATVNDCYLTLGPALAPRTDTVR